MPTATMDTMDEGVAHCEVVGGDGMCRESTVGGGLGVRASERRASPQAPQARRRRRGCRGVVAVSMILKASHQLNTRALISITRFDVPTDASSSHGMRRESSTTREAMRDIQRISEDTKIMSNATAATAATRKSA